jgi:predicted ATP-grasp superfamily ATP-dependent carboligase
MAPIGCFCSWRSPEEAFAAAATSHWSPKIWFSGPIGASAVRGRITGRVLVLGDYRQTVTVVRSLAKAGLEVILGTDDPHSSTALSRCVSRTWLFDGSSAGPFCRQLEAFLASERPEFAFAVGEKLLRHVLPAASRLEPLTTWVHADPATIARCFDKRALYELAPELGIPTLPWQQFSSAREWRREARDMGYPVVVKRKDSAAPVHERKALILRSVDELEAFLAGLAPDEDASSLVLQKYAPGARHNCHVAAAGGALIAYFEQKVLRTDELDDTGIGTAGVSVPPSRLLREHCARLMRRLGYTGVGCVQFLVDEATGSAAFLEFNPRMDSTAALPYRLGYDFPRLALELAIHRKQPGSPPPPPLTRPYRSGATYYWLYGDLNAWLACARARRWSAPRLAAWASSSAWLALRSGHLTFDWRDPLPTLHMFWRKFAVAPLRRLVRPAPQSRILRSK